MTSLATWECASDFCYQNSKWPPEVNSKKFVEEKTLKLSRKLFKFYYHIPHYMAMCNFWVGTKTQKNILIIFF